MYNLSILVFEPESLRRPFYRKIVALELKSPKLSSIISIGTLLNRLEDIINITITDNNSNIPGGDYPSHIPEKLDKGKVKQHRDLLRN